MDEVPYKASTQRLREWLFRVVPTGRYTDETLLQLKYVAVERKFITAKSDPFTHCLLSKNRKIENITKPTLADKLEAKYFANAKGCPTIPTVSVLDHDYDSFAMDIENAISEYESIVLKGSASSAANHVITSQTTRETIDQLIRSITQDNYYMRSREIVYKGLQSRAFIEPCLEPMDQVRDLKVHVLKGRPSILQIDNSRFTKHTQSYWDIENGLSRLPMSVGYGEDTDTQSPPISDSVLQELTENTKKLNFGEDYVRVDFLNVKSNLYLGEFTFLPWAQ